MPDEPHVHTRDCYDDAGPGRGGVSIICDKRETKPDPAATSAQPCATSTEFLLKAFEALDEGYPSKFLRDAQAAYDIDGLSEVAIAIDTARTHLIKGLASLQAERDATRAEVTTLRFKEMHMDAVIVALRKDAERLKAECEQLRAVLRQARSFALAAIVANPKLIGNPTQHSLIKAIDAVL